MSLRLLTGRANSEKSHFVLDEIKATLRQHPSGKAIFYVVPEQMTFQQEYALFKDDTIRGSTRAQVVSFSRLAWRVLQETGGSTKQFISSTGTQMMLRKIIEQRVEGFHIFQKATDKHGFIKELEGLITEFKRHLITPEQLEKQIHYATENVALQHKLMDLSYIYRELIALFSNKYIDGEDQLQLLTKKIASTDLFIDAEIYIDGFHRFTPNELAIITELVKRGRRVSIVLTMESKFAEAETELDLFFQTKQTSNHLKKIAENNHITVEEIQIDNEDYQRFLHQPYIAHLEKHYDDQPAPSLRDKINNPFYIKEAIHPRAEVEGVIQEILRLTREENYRYRDMVIYMREPGNYHNLIQTMFNDYGIPVFIDEKRTMLNHSFIEFIRSLFDVVESNWRYDAVFRLLKTGYIPATNSRYPLTMDAINELENYVLEYGIRTKTQWLTEQKWSYQRFRGFSDAIQTDKEKEKEIKINAYRVQVVQALQVFDRKIRESDKAQTYCEILYELLEDLDVPNQLETNRTYYDERFNIEKAREEEQVWNGVIQLIDEMVEMIGDEHLTFSMFKKTLEAGLEALEFSHVPPSMDHVIVGSIDHSRIDTKKCSFLLGVNEGVWPMKPALDGMINEQERAFLKQFGMELAASNRRVLLDDTFYMYLAFTTATEYVWVSYVLSDLEGRTKTPSQIIYRLQEFFPELESPELLNDPDELLEAERFITTIEKTRAPLTVQFSRYLRGYPMQEIWKDVLLWYMNEEPQFGTTYNVLQSLFYENKPISLTDQTIDKLYPKNVKTSVSRLEMFYRCSYQHFVQYNLQLENRRTYKLDAPDIGQLFHEALKTIMEWIQQEKKDFASMTKVDSATYAKHSMDYLGPILQHQILSSSNRYKYLTKKLEDIIAQAVYILSEQARLSGFSPAGIELGFGMDQGLEPLRITLPNGYELLLRGRIDRVDQAQSEDRLLLRIIDYKSSAHSLNLVDVYYGLALQMLTYLRVVLSQAEQWLGSKADPAGILYFHVHDAMLQETERLSEDHIADKIFKKYKMNGFISADEEIARLMDTSLDSGRSDIVPVGLKKDGSFYADSKIADQQTFDVLQHHLQRLLVDAGLHITSGNIELNPYENNQGNACQFCDFKSICQFDPLLNENNFRRLTPMKEKDIWSKLIDNEMKKVGKSHGNVDQRTTGCN